MAQLNKLQIKAEIMTVLSKLQMDIDTPYIDDYLSVLYEQDDKESILDILLKEFSRANETKSILICLVLVKLFESDILEKAFWDTLKNPSVSDAAKSVILNVLRDIGKSVDIDEAQNCFENPQNLVDVETQKLLDSAIINPETQIDFIDFLNSLSDEDKKILINSLAEDYSSDELANLLNPIVLYSSESEIGKLCIEKLGDTKSQLALYTLEEVLNFTKNEEIKSLVKKNISKLKLSGIREENAIKFYKELLPSVPYESYASYPDGHGNQALIFSREKDQGQLQMLAAVINDTLGIVDCFGFNSISKLEFNSIIDKFYGNDERVYMEDKDIKKLLLYAENLNHQNQEQISYEYICWRNLFADITCEEDPLDTKLKNIVKSHNLSEAEFNKFCMMNFVQKWFFKPHDNQKIGEIFNFLDEKVKEGDLNVDLENLVEENYLEVFDSYDKLLLDKRLLMSSYLKHLSGYNTDASTIFSIYESENKKTDLMKNIIRKSIYEHYVLLNYKLNEDKNTSNIFSSKDEKIDIDKSNIVKFIRKIEDLWVI